MLSNCIYDNLNDHYKKLCEKYSHYDCYQSNAIDTKMNNWLEQQQK